MWSIVTRIPNIIDLFIVQISVLFIDLKLAHIIDWNWFLVTLPIYTSIIGGSICG